MLLTSRDDLVSLLTLTSPGSVVARSCVGQIVATGPLPPSSPLGVWARGTGDVDPDWSRHIVAKDDSLAAQLEFLSLFAPAEVLSEPCPYRRLELARAWACAPGGPASIE